MIFNKSEIKSSINLYKNTGLYEIKLPGIKRQFESIYYSFEGGNKGFGSLYEKFQNKINDKIIGITKFHNYYIICFLDLTDLSSEYFFVKSFDVLKINLEGNNYYIFTYNDFENNLLINSDYEGDDFILEILDNKLVVKNSIFGTEIFSSKILFDNLLIEKERVIEYVDKKINLDIADFFVYDDYFIKSGDNNFNLFYNFITLFNNNIFSSDDNNIYKIIIKKYDDLYCPKIKLNLLSEFGSNSEKMNFNEFRKLLLSFFQENTVCYLMDNKNIEDYFSSYLNDFTHLEFKNFNLDFNIPDNIFNFDIKLDKFKLNFLKIRYNLFLLYDLYLLKDINGIKKDDESEYISLVENRLKITNSTLKINLDNYIEKYTKLLGIIESKLSK